MKRAIIPAAALALALAACGSVRAPAPAAKPMPHYVNAVACFAFHTAITTGVPNGDPEGLTTGEWVQTQEAGAAPQLLRAINAWVSAWNNPTNTAQINATQAAVQAICNESGT